MTITLQPGEHYAGIILGKNGQPDYHLWLLLGELEKAIWEQAMEWAKSIGGKLPNRREQALLYANLKEQFHPRWYWSSEQHAADPDYAWMQYFGGGYQDYYSKSDQCRARAVRRLLIIE